MLLWTGVDSLDNKIWGLIESVIYRALKKLLDFMGKDLNDAVFASLLQFLKFGIVGLSNTIISYMLYVVFLLLFMKLGILQTNRYLVAQGIAFVISVVWSFYWNNRIVFTLQEGENRSAIKAFVKTFVSYSFTGLVLNSALLILWVRVLHISEFIAPVINLLVSVPLNFIINKRWAFKNL